MINWKQLLLFPAWCACLSGTAETQQLGGTTAAWDFKVPRSRVADKFEGVDTPAGRGWLMVWIEVNTTGLPPSMPAERIRVTDGESNTYQAVAMDCEAAPHRLPLFVFFSDLKRRGPAPRTFANRGVWTTLYQRQGETKSYDAVGLGCLNAGPPKWLGKEWSRDELLLHLMAKPSPRISFSPYASKAKVVTLSFLFPVRPAAAGWQLWIGDGPAVPLPVGWAPSAEAWYQEIERYEYPDIVYERDVQDIVLSEDGSKVAVVIQHTARWTSFAKRYTLLAVNHEIKKTTFFDISHVVFSPDGQRLVYVFSDLKDFDPAPSVRGISSETRAVLPPDSLGSPAFASNSHAFGAHDQRIAYTYWDAVPDFGYATRWQVHGIAINDSVVLAPGYRHISRPVFHPDGRGLVYIRGQKSMSSAWDFARNPGPRGDLMIGDATQLVDGTFNYDTRGLSTMTARMGPRHHTAGIVFDEKGTIIYPAQWDKKWYLMSGTERASEGYDAMGLPVFGPENKVSFAAKQGKEWFIVTGGVRAPGSYEDVGLLVVSPDRKTLAFTAKQDDRWYAFANGQRISEGSWYVSELTYSADSKHLAYVLDVGKKVMLSDQGRSKVVVLDGKRVSPEFTGVRPVRSLTVSPDGTKVAYLANEPAEDEVRRVLYVNDRRVGPVEDYKLRPDGKLTVALFDAQRKLVIRGVVDF